jgi:threonine synthase
MQRATGEIPALPPHMADLFAREERFTILPNDLAAVQSAVRALAGRNAI